MQNKRRNKVLLIDDEADFCWIFSEILSQEDYEIVSAHSAKAGLSKVRKFMPDLVFLDLKLPDKNGVDVLKEIKKINPDTLVIMVTAYKTIETAVATMKLGAYDYLPKPVPNERLKIIVDKALETQRLSKEVESLRTGGAPLEDIIGQSPPMERVFKLIKSAASHDISVIIRGESGTGKELVARAIHSLSRRKNNPFIPIDCATLPETLVESELFGYERGAFTGADSQKIGKFETAEKGTLFLDEIGNLTSNIQVKLLRVLQERKIERLGGQRPIDVDVRLITATNRELEDAVRTGEFRDDLYHRLNVFELVLPPLRERGEDIIILSQYFLKKFNLELNREAKGFSDKVIDIFKRYRWPGNVRELENTIKSSVLMAEDKILPEHLPFHIQKTIGEASHLEPLPAITNIKEAKKSITEKMERDLIEKTLNQTNWNKRKAAKLLGIDYKSLFSKIKKYGITR